LAGGGKTLPFGSAFLKVHNARQLRGKTLQPRLFGGEKGSFAGLDRTRANTQMKMHPQITTLAVADDLLYRGR
jgi:hypothetical protein